MKRMSKFARRCAALMLAVVLLCVKGRDVLGVDFTGGTAFVIGSEGFGMSRLVGEKCDAMLSLPMRGKVNSLNASVAAGIFLYEAVRQRLAK